MSPNDNEDDPEVILLEEPEETRDAGDMPRVIRAPKSPTTKERELHEAIHLPHADWCEFCVRGRSRNKIHPSVSRRSAAKHTHTHTHQQ